MRHASFDGTVRFIRPTRYERFVRVLIESDDGSASESFDADKRSLCVRDGEWVERGAPLVRDELVPDEGAMEQERSLENLLCVVGQRGPGATASPTDGTIVALASGTVTIARDDGTRHTLPLRRPAPWVTVGARVVAGDPLSEGSRRHRSLLLYWPRARVAEHIAGELDRCALAHSAASPRHTALFARALATGRRAFERALREGHSSVSTADGSGTPMVGANSPTAHDEHL